MASAFSDRTFGIELECIVRHSVPAPSDQRQYTIVARHIQTLTILDIIHPEYPYYNEYKNGRRERSDWMIIGDSSVEPNDEDFRYSRERMLYPHLSLLSWYQLWNAAEIISPILTENNWGEVVAILNAIQTPPMGVIHNKSTSTHIHIGIQPNSAAPLGTEGGLHTLKHVAAVYYIFETYLNLLCPDHRVNTFCRRTRRSYFGKRNTPREFCDAIYDVKSLRNIHYYMNCAGVDENDELIPERYYGANFANCMHPWEKWTVEFRSHEGTKDSYDLQSWGKILMRLFDQAVAADWDYILELCASSESFDSEEMCGDENDRELDAWREWVASMHILFVTFLAGPALRENHMDPEAPSTLEEYILSQPTQMTNEEYADDDIRPVREEEILLQNLINHIIAREYKFKPQYETFMEGNFDDWSSEYVRDDLPGDWVDYPNPSGIVLDYLGRDIPINSRYIPNLDFGQFPAA